MKKVSVLLAILMLLSFTTTAFASTIVSNEYTDVPAAMTQDTVRSVVANENCEVELLQPDNVSIALLDDVYRFVWEEENRPARYYDEQTQREIQKLCGNRDIDILHMTEAMRMQLRGEPEKAVMIEMELDVDYRPGQLVIVVMGIPEEKREYTWYPYRVEVPETGLLQWEIPVEDWEELCGQPISFHALTVRMGPDGEYLWGEDAYPDSDSVFSKTSSDVYRTHRWYTESGEVIEDDFRLYLTHLTEPMQEEILRIGGHIAEEKLLLDYFPEERKEEALLMFPEGIEECDLVAYDIIALQDENYKDTYGDIHVEIRFGTTYDTEKAMVVLAGFENKTADQQPYMDWFVLRTEALVIEENETVTDLVRIGLKQLNLSRMEEEPLMLVVVSQKLDDQKYLLDDIGENT